jgi:hypothetical protein
MKQRTNQFIIGIIVLGVIGIGGYFVSSIANQPGELDAFAQCLEEKGATFYGAFWCPHCQNQKALFGSSQKHLPYVECSNPDGRSQNETCNEAGIEGYPTWQFADGSRQSGEVPLEVLAERSGCELP